MSEQKQEARCATTQNNNDPNTQKQQQTAVKKNSATRRLGFRRKRIPQNRELLIPCCKIFY